MNLASVPGIGDPGGEGGMSRFGYKGKVRFLMVDRWTVYGEDGVVGSFPTDISALCDKLGPDTAPIIGKDDAVSGVI